MPVGEPLPAVPLALGLLSFAGGEGTVSTSVGAAGAWVSTVKPVLAGVGSVTLPSSIALTSNVWAASESVPAVWGDVQAANAAESTRHWKVECGLVEVNSNVGVESFVREGGADVIVVSGTELS